MLIRLKNVEIRLAGESMGIEKTIPEEHWVRFSYLLGVTSILSYLKSVGSRIRLRELRNLVDGFGSYPLFL